MSKDEFYGLMNEMQIAFGENRFPMTKEVMKVWFSYLKDCKYEFMNKAVRESVKHSIYPPTIADLFSYYNEFVAQEKEKINDCRQVIRFAIGSFPGCMREDGIVDYLCEIVGWDIVKANRMKSKLEEILRRVEKTGKVPEHSLKELAVGDIDELLG